MLQRNRRRLAWSVGFALLSVALLWAPNAGAGGASTGLKPPLAGFLDRSGTPAYAWITGYLVPVNWSQLQPHGPGSRLVARANGNGSNPIDDAIAQVRQWNASHGPGEHRGLKIRIDSGGGAPDWAKHAGGAPVAVVNSQGPTCTVGRYWTEAFQDAYANLQQQLAALYDAVPEVREVTVAGNSLCYEEPFLHYSWNALSAAGDTVALDKASYVAMMRAHQVWHHTLQDLSFNPYNVPGGGGEAFTAQSMQTFRSMFGAQGLLENNSLRASGLGAPYLQMYDTMASHGGPICFQTATLARMGSPSQTFADAVRYAAYSVELPSGYASQLSESMLQSYQAKLLANLPGRG